MQSQKSQIQQIEALENEVQFYKDLIQKLPFEIHYKSKQFNKTLYKAKNNDQISVTEYSHSSDDPTDELKINFYSETEFPIEAFEGFLESIFDFIPHHILAINKDGYITICNKQIAEDLGFERDRIHGMHIQDLLNIPKEQILTLKAIEMNKDFINQEVLDKNYGIINTRIIRDSNDEIIRVIGTFQFLNNLKDTEKLSLIGKIAAGIAHEVRNPLTTVRGYLQLLAETSETETANMFRSILIPEIDRANKIITDFLMLAKPSEMKVETIEINDFMNYFYNLIYSDALIHHVNIQLQLDERNNNKKIKVDRNQLLQVLLNLFRNTIEAKNKTSINLKIKTNVESDHVFITFEDNGVGIDSNNINKIFDPFFTTKEMGTGLGLSVSRKIIEMHGGEMKVESIPKEKTTFSIKFPLQ
jgi:signal transduction histidine kinase